MADDAQKRKFFRLSYPPNDRPVLTFKGNRYLALDISEEGLRISLSDVKISHLREGLVLDGTIEFGSRGTFPVQGIILRIHEDSAAIKLKKPIPLSHIMAEQRYLIQKYKKV